MARAGPSSSTKSVSKPYDRTPYQLKTRGKGKAKASEGSSTLLPSKITEKGVNLGAPAQLGQTSRKGKKAWRKNIDVADIEKGLEESRKEERLTGGKIHERRNEALFTVDVTGDADRKLQLVSIPFWVGPAKSLSDQGVATKLRASRPKKPLRSLAILQERSAVPSLTSRATPSSSTPKIRNSEKARLRKLALREFRPDGAAAPQIEIAPTTILADAWADDNRVSFPGGFGDDGVKSVKPNLPPTLRKLFSIRQSAIENGRTTELPTPGTSYNPSEESHAALIQQAVEEELGKLSKEAKEDVKTALMSQVITARRDTVPIGEFAEGMAVGPGEDGDDLEEEAGEGERKVKPTKRKTQAQRNKAARLRAAKEEAKRAAAHAKVVKAVGSGSLKALRKAEEEKARAAEQVALLRKIAKREKERLGFEGGERVGRGRVMKGDVTVQLGEDLAETLRQVKACNSFGLVADVAQPEGNHFKDSYLALQKKGLVAPRDERGADYRRRPGRKSRTKEFEKHAYKRFE